MILRQLLAILGTMRLRQWTKNLFVLAPLVFSHHLFSDRLAAALWMTLAFGLASSAVYFFNDLRDRPMDRLHPVKRLRPIAAGRLPPATAWVTLTVFSLASLGLALAIGGPAGLLFLGAYLVLNAAYSLRLKRVAYLDVLCISAGFLLRVFAGAAAVEVPVSFWIQVNTLLLAAFLGFGKRLHELSWVDDGNSVLRPALGGYRRRTLDRLLLVFQVLIPLTFLAYTLDPVSLRHHTLIFTVPLMAAALYRFHRLCAVPGNWHSPTDRMLRDPWFLLAAGGWICSVLLLLYR
jgi:4-hydroxybenzoate polyprenyltransferase